MSRLHLAATAVKEQLKARVAITGPAGAGKTMTALQWATVLAGDNGNILVIDSERRSSSLYADRFRFDTIDWKPPYSPQELTATMLDASDKYDVIIIDSISHWWEGDGGVLDFVDSRSPQGNKFAGWKEGTPVIRALIESILAANAHVIVTMRSKMEYVLETNERGKQVPKKVGMAPVMRNGIEYEFTVVGDMDLANALTFTKSRCDALSGRTFLTGEIIAAAETFEAWLNDGVAKVSPAEAEQIRAAVHAIQNPKVRSAIARSFKATFGEVDHLPADLLQQALDFIAAEVAVQCPIDTAANEGEG